MGVTEDLGLLFLSHRCTQGCRDCPLGSWERVPAQHCRLLAEVTQVAFGPGILHCAAAAEGAWKMPIPAPAAGSGVPLCRNSFLVTTPETLEISGIWRW